MDNATAETYAEKLNDYYNAGHYNLYSSTYQWMRSDAADDSDLDYLEYNFNQIIAAYQRKYPKDEEGQKRVTKLADYILLEQAPPMEMQGAWQIGYFQGRSGLPLARESFDISAARKAKHLTQAQLADLMGVDQALVSRWESGKVSPNKSNLERLKEILK